MHEQVSSDYNQESLDSIHGRIGRIRFLVYSLLLNIMLIPLVLIAGGLFEAISYLFGSDSLIANTLIDSLLFLILFDFEKRILPSLF